MKLPDTKAVNNQVNSLCVTWLPKLFPNLLPSCHQLIHNEVMKREEFTNAWLLYGARRAVEFGSEFVVKRAARFAFTDGLSTGGRAAVVAFVIGAYIDGEKVLQNDAVKPKTRLGYPSGKALPRSDEVKLSGS